MSDAAARSCRWHRRAWPMLMKLNASFGGCPLYRAVFTESFKLRVVPLLQYFLFAESPA